MDIQRLKQLLRQITEYSQMINLHPNKATDVNFEICWVRVDLDAADFYRTELVGIVKEYPNPRKLMNDASCIEVGQQLGGEDGQEMAFRLFALGYKLGWWELLTPDLVLHRESWQGIALARQGGISISGFNLH